MEDFLVFENVCKGFGALRAVDRVSLSIRQGEFFSLLGPSGCGKTTLLRILGGFERPDSGRVLLAGEEITTLPPDRRKVNTIFQNYALFPHLTVRDNVGFGLKVAGLPRREREDEVARMLHLTQLDDQGDKFPRQLSGGQRQRVAIGRALIMRPRVLLLDEPLAALDLKLRQRMLYELDLIHEEVGITFLYVTHDQGEAMSLSDRMAVMNHGKVEQVGAPAEIYETPTSSFVAAFIGDTNFFEGEVAELVDDDYLLVRSKGFPEVLCFNDKRLKAGDRVHLSIRPEKFAMERTRYAMDRRHNAVTGRVEDIIYLGDHTRFRVRVEEHLVTVFRQHNHFLLDRAPFKLGEEVHLYWHADDGFMLERYHQADEQLLSLASEAPTGGDNEP